MCANLVCCRMYGIFYLFVTGKLVGYQTTRCSKKWPQCSICSRKFHSRNNRDEHVRRHKWMVYNCRVCGAMYEDFNCLRVHCRDSHPTERRPKAADKEIYRIRVSTANIEPGTQNNQENFLQENNCSATKIIKRRQKSCNICSDCPGYQNVTRRCSDGGERLYTAKARISELICKFCGRRFRTIFVKTKHEAQHEKMVYRCPGRCGYMFIHFKELQWHYRFVHGSNLKRSDEERCKILGKNIAKNKISETQDRPSQNSEAQKMTHSCPFDGCRFQYKTFDVLINHAKKRHRTEQEPGEQTVLFKRRKISANSAEMAPISVTQKLVGKRTYWPKCSICQRLFRSVADRNYHEQNHHLMQYKCPDTRCGFMFESFATMYKHSHRYHDLRLGAKMERCKKNNGDDQSLSVTKQSRADAARLCGLNISSKAKQMNQVGNISNKAKQMDQVGTRKRHHGTPKCKFCNRCFKALTDRDAHEEQHEFMRYKCPYVGCNQLFLNFWLLSAHHGNRHERCLKKSEEMNCKIHHKKNVLGEIPDRSLGPDESNSLPAQSANSAGRKKSTVELVENIADCEELDAEEEPEDFALETNRAVAMPRRKDVTDQIVTVRQQPRPYRVTVPARIAQTSKMPTEAISRQVTTTSKETTTKQALATDDDNDHAEFYDAVINGLRRLDAESRSLATIQVMKILHYAEFNSSFSVPRVPRGFRNAKRTDDKHCEDDITLCKEKIRHALERLSVERRERAKCRILLIFLDEASHGAKLNPIPVDDD